jgi:hypothetical protein
MAEGTPVSTLRKVWLRIFALGGAAVALGLYGYWRMLQENLEAARALPDGAEHTAAVAAAGYDFWDVLFGTLGLFVFNPPPWTTPNLALNVARYLAFAATIGIGAVAVYALFSDQILAWRLRRWKNHVVVCGLGYKGFTFVQNLRKHYDRIVVIESDATNPAIEECRALGVRVIVGDAQHELTLKKAGVQRAEWLLSVCPSDAINTEILWSARTAAQDRNKDAEGALRCLAQISNPLLCDMLTVPQREHEMQKWQAEFFNTDDTSASIMVDEYPVRPVGSKSPHMLVAHLDPLGRRVIVVAAQTWLSQRDRSDLPLVITVIDDHAEQRLDALKRQHPFLKNEKDFTFYCCSTSPQDIEDLKATYAPAAVPKPTRAYVTAADDDESVTGTLLLLSHLNIPVHIVAALSRKEGAGKLFHSLAVRNVEVFGTFERTCTPALLFKVSVEELAKEIHELWLQAELAKLKKVNNALDKLKSAADGGSGGLATIREAIVRLNRESDLDAGSQATIGDAVGKMKPPLSPDDVALRTIGDAIATLDKKHVEDGGVTTLDEVIKEFDKRRKDIGTPRPWGEDALTEADTMYRASSLAQANDIPAKLRAIRCSIVPLDEMASDFAFTDEEVELLAAKEHVRWIAERRNAGWTLGPKDVEKKFSPYLVPFGELEKEIADYDRMFVRGIPSLLKDAGYKAIRNPPPKAD